MTSRSRALGFATLTLTCLAAAHGCGGSTGETTGVGAVTGQTCTTEGARTYAKDGCNLCVCTQGAWACTSTPCTTTCQNGQSTFDGCNTCTCTGGAWACTKKSCGVCVDGSTTNDGCNTCSCSNGQWMCTARACPPPECPAPKSPPPGVMCTAMVVYAKDPQTGACCEYGSGCNAPAGWTLYPSLAQCQGAPCTEGQTRPAGDGCNTCSCSGGQWMCTLRACMADGGMPPDSSMPRMCGGLGGFTCGPTEYCAYVEGQMCGAADASSTCQPRPQACDLIYAPVCGCDQQTYGNSCQAASAGTGVYHSGACP